MFRNAEFYDGRTTNTQTLVEWNGGDSTPRPKSNLGEFINVICQGSSAEFTKNSPLGRSFASDESPQSSPGSVSAFHLGQSVLQVVGTSLDADVVVVAILHPPTNILAMNQPTRLAETVLSSPKGLVSEAISFTPEMIQGIRGMVVDTEGWNLPYILTENLGARPKRFIASRIKIENYEGVLYAFWTNPARVHSSAEAVLHNASRTFPVLLANRVIARRSERLGRQFDSILKRMPQAVVLVDDELAQVVVNPAAAKLLDLPCFGEVDPVTVAGSMRQLAERSGSRSDLQRWFTMVLGVQDSVIDEEWELENPRRVLRVQSFPISNRANMVNGRLWLFEDLTAERIAREAIKAANRAKSQFLAMMSHELRTPMTGVLGMLDLLKLTQMEKEQIGLLKVMQSSAEGLMTVINNILDFCKMEANRLTLEEIDFNLQELIEQAAEMFRTQADEKSLCIKIKEPNPIEGSNHRVRGDPVRLKQVIVNLISNAVKFTEKGGVTITWSTCDPPPNILFESSPSSPLVQAWGKKTPFHPSFSTPLLTHQNPSMAWPSKDAQNHIHPSPSAGSMNEKWGYSDENEQIAEDFKPSLRRSGISTPSGSHAHPQLPNTAAGSAGMSSPESMQDLMQDNPKRHCNRCGVTLASEMGHHSSFPAKDHSQARILLLCKICYHQDIHSNMASIRHPSSQDKSFERREGSFRKGGEVKEIVDDSDKEKDSSQWFRICVSDTGCGMTEETLQSVFDSSQAGVYRNDAGGTGLGLAICKGILTLMGGRIWAESRLNEGSDFVFLFPLSPPEINVVAEKVCTPPENNAHPEVETKDSCTETKTKTVKRSFGSLNVLVAEDNKVNQLLIRKILKHYGHQVELVGNGKLALEQVQVKEYDLVLMDLQMPILDGLNATRAIRKLPPPVCSIPIYALTADVVAPEIEDAGMDGFLSKPIVWDTMSLVVDQILNKKALSSQISPGAM